MRKTDIAGKRLLMDADTIGHFCKGRLMGHLRHLLKGQLYLVDDVEAELTERLDAPHRTEVLQAIQVGVLTRLDLPQDREIRTEYNTLCRIRTAGEAACLALGRFAKDSVVITNLPCLARYCQKWGITFTDTVGLLGVAYHESLLTPTDLHDFVQKVRQQGGRLTDTALQQLLQYK